MVNQPGTIFLSFRVGFVYASFIYDTRLYSSCDFASIKTCFISTHLELSRLVNPAALRIAPTSWGKR